MSSNSDRSSTIELVTQLLRELGVAESRASLVHELIADASSTGTRAKATAIASPLGRPNKDAETLVNSATLMAARLSAPRAPTMGSGIPDAYGSPSERLVRGAQLGAGGMGEVLRVSDRALHRSLAMKVLLAELGDHATMRDRFIEEAKVTGQLAHPGIPPVHEIGLLEDGRPYFTMKEVRGSTLADVIAEAHDDHAGAARISEQRLLEIFQRVCEAVAYAHARGVVHCDLKPQNVMVGAFGEVLVMDWGVARLVPSSGPAPIGEPPVTVGGASTSSSVLGGTPAYMAPEQAFADAAPQVGPPSDVYALGVMLFELLAGWRPYSGTLHELVAQALTGNVPDLPRRPGSIADDSLYAIITRAMAPMPKDRYTDAKAMADDLALWREGATRREKALSTVRAAQAMIPSVEPMFAEATDLRERAARELARSGPDAPVEAKEPAWELLDRGAKLAQGALLRQLEAEQLLFNALAHAPELAEAKSLIARMRFNRHRDAELRRAWDEAAGHELVLRANDTGELRDYLEGTAPLTLHTTPKCTVRLHRVVRRARRLVPELVRELGETPLIDVELPIGSYLLELVAPDRSAIRYPVLIRRREGWMGRRPGDTSAYEVRIPPESAPGEIVVAAGCCELGGDELAPGAHRRQRMWVDGFVIREHQVTFGELASFLATRAGAPFRRGVLRDGLEVWRHDWPAVGLSWEGARAYAAWVANETGLPWRLPTEIEWEKAARGVDGRFFPWGDVTDPAFAHARTVERNPKMPVPVSAFPSDVSPYGVRGMGGNVRDWCGDAGGAESYLAEGGIALPAVEAPAGAERIVRGGSWRQAPDAARVAARASLAADNGYADVGFRLVRSI